MIETIYLARHGFRLSWESTIWQPVTGTPRDPPLSAHGCDQAVELAEWLSALPEEEKPQAIFSSPLYRCLQTATPAAEALGSLPIYVEFGVAEWYLPVRANSAGLHPRSLPPAKLKQWFPLIASEDEHESVLYPNRKGESMKEVHERAETTLRALLRKLDAKEGLSTIVIFTHAATNIAMGRALTNDPDLHIKSATCSVGKYKRIPGQAKDRNGLGVWACEMNGETGFMKDGEERHWDFTFVEEYEEDGVLEDGTELGPLASDNYKTEKLGTAAGAPNGKL